MIDKASLAVVNTDAEQARSHPRARAAKVLDAEMADRVKEIRRLTIETLIESAQKMLLEPDNYDHIGQIYYCVKNYEEAQMILNPRFFD